MLSVLVIPAAGQTSESGRVRYAKRANPEFNQFTNFPTTSLQQWLRDHIVRLGVYSPYFDNKLSWYPNGWLYLDLYAIHTNSALAAQHSEWILKDSAGRNMYIPWNCSGGTCPQYAGDVGSSSFRRWWIDQAKPVLAKGYKGIWLDDVNMMFRVGNGNQVEVPPIDPRTGTTMTYDNWRRYVAEFLEQIRAELPGYEILHNSIWYAGPAGVRDNDPYVQREIAAANYINCERGLSDGGLTGGTDIWSVRAFLSFIDRVHARGRAVVLDEYYPPNMEYSLAGYFLISTDKDMIGDLATTPDNWWPGYDVVLGTPSGPRYDWSGLIRRDFDGGIVLLNEPGAATKTVTLPGSYKTITNAVVTSVTLPAKSAAVLRLVSAPAPALGPTQYQASALTWKSATNGHGPVERDMSNGEAGTADGRALKLAGVTHSRGLGVHAPSDIRYNIGGACSTFQASIGLDDEIANNGSVIFQVFADGSKLYESALFRGSSATGAVNVSVVGKQEIRLVVTDAGDGRSYDHADWATAQITCASAPPAAAVPVTTFLSDRAWIFATNGWGPVEKDRSNGGASAGDGVPMRLNGIAYTKGLGVHAPSEVRYSLAGACSAFKADVGVDDEVSTYGSIVFEVWGDSVKLFDSASMTGASVNKSFNVNLTGKNELRLIVHDANNGIESDHGDWANAQITCR